MSGSIQLPAQFTAAHVSQVHQLMKAASEPDPAGMQGRRKAADQALQRCLFIPGFLAVAQTPVSYTHLTLPTNREV